MEFTREQNKALIEHFPYLQPRNLWTDEIVKDYDYDHIRGQWDLPDGWHRLFLLYCMSIKPILKKANFIDQFRFSQLKEKWGEMTLYDNGVPQDIHEEMSDIKYIYERISALICQHCGNFAEYEARGWVSFFCKNCIAKIFDEGDYNKLDEPDFIIKITSWKPSSDSNSSELIKIVREIDAFPYFEEYLNCLKLTDEEFLKYILRK